jgi:D-lactate dehydrogenase (cytochrome)
VLSALEYVDGAAMRLSGEALGRRAPPLATPAGGFYPYYLLIEGAGSEPKHDEEKMTRMLETLLARGIAEDGVLATSVAQARSLWRCREETPVGLAKRGWVFKYDVSLGLGDFPQLVAQTNQRLLDAGVPATGSGAVVGVGYGHLADGNIHLNVSTAIPQSSCTSVAGEGEGCVFPTSSPFSPRALGVRLGASTPRQCQRRAWPRTGESQVARSIS